MPRAASDPICMEQRCRCNAVPLSPPLRQAGDAAASPVWSRARHSSTCWIDAAPRGVGPRWRATLRAVCASGGIVSMWSSQCRSRARCSRHLPHHCGPTDSFFASTRWSTTGPQPSSDDLVSHGPRTDHRRRHPRLCIPFLSPVTPAPSVPDECSAPAPSAQILYVAWPANLRLARATGAPPLPQRSRGLGRRMHPSCSEWRPRRCSLSYGVTTVEATGALFSCATEPVDNGAWETTNEQFARPPTKSTIREARKGWRWCSSWNPYETHYFGLHLARLRSCMCSRTSLGSTLQCQ